MCVKHTAINLRLHSNGTSRNSSSGYTFYAHCSNLRKIGLIESLTKCRYLKNLPVKVYYLSEAPSPPMTPYSLPPLHTGGGELTREKVRGAIVHKAGRKYHQLLTVSPVYKLY
jgi:hypothetical protein